MWDKRWYRKEKQLTTVHKDYSGTQQSNLANKLIPPEKPRMPGKAEHDMPGWVFL
jgi:hypothetical protein